MGNPKYDCARHGARHVQAMLVAVGSLLVGCSLIYDTDNLPSQSDAPDDMFDAPMLDGSEIDADPNGDAPVSMPDAHASGPDADPTAPDANVPDALPPDAACGGTGQICCPGNQCAQWHECGGGTCTACGGTLQSCCDPGMTCQGALSCVLGACTI